MENKILKVLARREVVFALAGAGAASLTGVGGYFLGAKRERQRILDAFTDRDMPEELPQEFKDIVRGRLVEDREISELMEMYGPALKEVDYARLSTADFERAAQPLADEILGKTDAVEAPEDEDQEWYPVATTEQVLDKIEKRYNEHFAEADERNRLVISSTQETHNIWASSSSDGNWDLEEEQASRTSERPYIIHQEEFINQDSGFEQSTLTYFAKDGVVVDELNEPLQDWVSTLGQLRFGHGTTDANAVYIRNEKLQHEFEVLLSTGAYLDEIMGQEAELEIERDELRHSMNLRMRARE